ncbi:MAG: GNAT family N-acetyltransferase [Bacteroidota bacterium]
MPTPIIRFAEQKDLPEIIQLCALHAAYEQSDYNESGKAEALAQSLFSESPALFCLVVEEGSELIGYATYMPQYSTWDAKFYVYMDCLFMKEAARSKGIGQQLVERIQLEGVQLGCDLIQWQTPDFNHRAIKFYKRIGATAKSKERFFLAIA